MAAYDYFENLFKNEKVELVTNNGLSPYIGPNILNEVIEKGINESSTR